jgi:predicted outer membrane repeat protein
LGNIASSTCVKPCSRRIPSEDLSGLPDSDLPLYRKEVMRSNKRQRLVSAICCAIDELESRTLFSTYTVTTLGDAAGTVTPDGSGSFKATTLRAAITATNAAAGADSIHFASGLTGTIELGKALPAIADDLALSGPGQSKLTIERSSSAAGDFSVLQIQPDTSASISGLTIAKGTGTRHVLDAISFERTGGGIDNRGALSLEGCLLKDNHVSAENPNSGFGGALYNSGSARVVGCTFKANKATEGGGAVWNGGKASFSDCDFSGNYAPFGGVFYNAAGAKLNLFAVTLTGNSATQGGAIQTEGSLSIAASRVAGNHSLFNGGAILAGQQAVVTLSNSQILDNSTGPESGGGGIYSEGRLTLRGCVVSGNSADFYGGIENLGTLSLTSCTISKNTAVFAAGGVYNQGSATITQCTISQNKAGGAQTSGVGGGILNQADATLVITDSRITGNTTSSVEVSDGGGIYNAGNATITNCSIVGNTGGSQNGGGGGLFNAGTATLRDCNVSNNVTPWLGGAVANIVGGTVTATNCRFNGNFADEAGAIYNNGQFIASRSTFAGNSATESSGGLHNDSDGETTLSQCAVFSNGASDGGGIVNFGSLTINSSTFSGNHSDISAGAILNNSHRDLVVTNSTFFGNSGEEGGAIWSRNSSSSGGRAAITNCTISGNSANKGGGIFNVDTIALDNCIVVGNSGQDITNVDESSPAVITLGSANNLIGVIGGHNAAVKGKNGNLIGVTTAQLKLGPLANNGGSTLTMALRPGSIAIDAGSDAKAVGADGKPLTTDQRGRGRIGGAHVDVGAYESAAVVHLYLVDASRNVRLFEIKNGMTIRLSDLPTKSFSIEAVTSPITVGSVRFQLDSYSHTENLKPYGIFGTRHAIFVAGALTTGVHQLSATPFDLQFAHGAAGTALALTFTVVK